MKRISVITLFAAAVLLVPGKGGPPGPQPQPQPPGQQDQKIIKNLGIGYSGGQGSITLDNNSAYTLDKRDPILRINRNYNDASIYA